MSCKHLVYGYRSLEKNPETGNRGIVWGKKVYGKGYEPACRPCGQCIDCRLNDARMNAIRVVKEQESWQENTVVTLTYAKEHLPIGDTIYPPHAVKFMKDLREYFRYHQRKTEIRSYGCAEYGEKFGRPHYHIILFNHEFTDQVEIPGRKGYYRSSTLDQLWGKGRTEIMDLTWDTASYVAQYVMKKLTGKRQEEYEQKEPDRSICVSRNPGIAYNWYTKHKKDICYRDKININGIDIKPPTYFDRRYEIENPDEYEKVKEKRKIQLKKHMDKILQEVKDGNRTNYMDDQKRARAHEVCNEAKQALRKRNLEP